MFHEAFAPHFDFFCPHALDNVRRAQSLFLSFPSCQPKLKGHIISGNFRGVVVVSSALWAERTPCTLLVGGAEEMDIFVLPRITLECDVDTHFELFLSSYGHFFAYFSPSPLLQFLRIVLFA